MHEFIVEELKIRLDKYLAKQLPQISRSQIQRDIEGGCAEINGETITKSKFVVRLDDKVVYHQPDKTDGSLKATNTPLRVLYNNHGLIVIDKPPGLAVHPGAGFKGETLASALLYKFKDIHLVGEEHRPGIVHRLDKDTSGVMLVAANQEMYLYLKDAFAERKIKKEYIALVYGKVEKPHGFIETPIGKSKTDFRKQDTKNVLEPKEALTEYQVLEYLSAVPATSTRFAGDSSSDKEERLCISSDIADNRGASPPPLRSGGREADGVVGAGIDECTLLLVKLHTGRTHQIRVHLASIGHPLMGDGLYGNKRTALKGLNRQFLHAKKIEVRISNGTWIEAEADFPEDLRKVLVSLNSKVVKSL
jgi:23S rRNA pseudouridine1911/1915/1917 synthase